jgi:hypothetical protein
VTAGAAGEALGVLTSADVTKEDVIIHAAQSQAIVSLVWENYYGDERWVETPENPPPAQAIQIHRAVQKLDNIPMDGHLLEFYLEQVDYTDEQGNMVSVTDSSDCPNNLSDWATFYPYSARTDYQGAVVAPLGVYEHPEHFKCQLYDLDVWVH